MSKQPPPKTWFDSAKDDLGRMEFLAQAGVDPAMYAGAKMSEREGFELPNLAQQHLFSQALLNIAAQKHYQPPPVPESKAIYCGDSVDTGQPAFLNADESGHILLAGATKTGKNNAAHQLFKGFLELRKHGEVLAQKGDELGMTDQFPGALYLPIEKEPWNDWAPIGPDAMAFWTANAEGTDLPGDFCHRRSNVAQLP